MTPKNNPLVSIVMPVYNAEDTVIQSLLSVQDQTMGDWELLLVDDGSTDGTAKICNHFSKTDFRITYSSPSGTRGPGPARQRGVGVATGKFVAFLDADDIWLPEKLDQGLAFMRISGSSWVHTAYRAILQSGKVGRKIGSRIYRPTGSLLGENTIALSTTLVDRALLPTEIDFYSHAATDRQLWLHLLRNGHKPAYNDAATTLYRLSSQSVSSDKLKMAAVRLGNLKFEAPNHLKRLGIFLSYAVGASAKNLMRRMPSRGCERENLLLEMLEQRASVVKAKLQR